MTSMELKGATLGEGEASHPEVDIPFHPQEVTSQVQPR